LFPSSGTQFAEQKRVDQPCIEELSSRFFDLDEDNIQIKKHSSPTDLAEAGQGDPVFMVYSKKGESKGVIKSVLIETPEGAYSFKSEYESLMYLNQARFKNFHMLKLRGIGEMDVDGKTYGLIAEEFAKGYSINHYLKMIGKSQNKKTRTENFNELQKAVKKLGSALAELNCYHKYSKPSHDYVMKFDSENLPGPYGIIHGDTHPGNIFYDPKTDTISFIDFGSMNLKQKGAPVLQDAGNFLSILEIFSSYYSLTDSELNQLKSSFLETYRSEIPEATEESISFYENYFFKTFASLENSDKMQKHQASFIHDYCEKKLETI
jgi:serine/threonine protein kinase